MAAEANFSLFTFHFSLFFVPLKLRFESTFVRKKQRNLDFFLVFCSLIRTFAAAFRIV